MSTWKGANHCITIMPGMHSCREVLLHGQHESDLVELVHGAAPPCLRVHAHIADSSCIIENRRGLHTLSCCVAICRSPLAPRTTACMCTTCGAPTPRCMSLLVRFLPAVCCASIRMLLMAQTCRLAWYQSCWPSALATIPETAASGVVHVTCSHCFLTYCRAQQGGCVRAVHGHRRGGVGINRQHAADVGLDVRGERSPSFSVGSCRSNRLLRLRHLHVHRDRCYA